MVRMGSPLDGVSVVAVTLSAIEPTRGRTMSIDERTRHRLYQRLQEVLGADEASILMEHLPPVGWADVATRRDLDQLSDRIDARLERALRRQTWALITSQAALFVLAGLFLSTR